MRKAILFSFLILFSLTSVYSEQCYFYPYDSCFNVNLEVEKEGTASGEYQSDYVDSDMVGLLGVANNGGALDNTEYVIEITSTSDDPWTYKSLSDPSLEIPFGLDMVVRYKTNQLGGADHKTAGVVHLGYNDRDNSTKIGDYITMQGSTDSQVISSFSVKPPTGSLPRHEWGAFWIDIVLTISADAKSNFKYGSADDYQASFTITVKKNGNVLDSYPFIMSGYFGNYTVPNGGFVIFSVMPNSNATSLDLTDAGNGYASSPEQIGEFFYSTQAYRNDDIEDHASYDYTSGRKSPIRILVSSSDSLDSAPTMFYLTNINAPDGNTSPSLNIPFRIGLKSKGYNGYLVDNDIRWFDGTDTRSSAKALQGYGIYAESRSGDKEGITLQDSGTIWFEIPEGYNATPSSGYYSANIYFHLYSEL